MATRSFVLEEDQSEGLKILRRAAFPEKVAEVRREFSLWLEERLLNRLKSVGGFEKSRPILLGSWSRHELAPKSDIDILFIGKEEEVAAFVKQALQSGLKLRSRTPQDPNDWSVGVEPFDVLAVLLARALNPEDEAKLAEQKKLLFAQRRALLKAVRKEREERRKRQDSVSNYLEPNLKFGAGGLRDIEQALALKQLFPKAFLRANAYPFEVLEAIKEEFLFLRHQLHMAGSGDILTAHDQIELARLLKMESPAALMKFVQSELERASFYADWVVSYCMASDAKRVQAQKPIRDLKGALARLKNDPGILNQFAIRLQVEDLTRAVKAKDKGRKLAQLLFGKMDDELIIALHRTRLLEMLIPDLRQLRGLVQHDHYHRFTADAHLVQTLRETQRAQRSSKILGPLGAIARDLNRGDWLILKFTSLFHDLAKGRKGDHSTEGAALVGKYFEEWDLPASQRDDVHWLVQNHLILSTAAFRQNPKSQATWQRLFERGVAGRRLTLLALFTAIDIRATNPEAWTPWKSQLLLELVNNLRSPQAKRFQAHLSYADRRKIKLAREWLLDLDPALLESLKPKVVLEDLKACASAHRDLEPLVIKGSKGRLWVRFHHRQDQTGLFMGFVRRLFGFGLSIQSSAVHTIKDVGVYDWFCLRTEKPARQVAKWLSLKSEHGTQSPKVRFQSIEVMSEDETEWILSFRGKDQRGLLLAAAEALSEEKLSVRWARVHTWGQQVEDIFSVRPLGEAKSLIERLRLRFVT